MKHLLLTLFISVISSYLLAQSPDLPNDFLGKAWHKERRANLRASMPANSVAVFFANAVRNRSNDVDYVYHQDPNFFYLTGYREPEAVLLIFKNKQTAANGTSYDEIIFVQERNAMAEMWTGRRLGAEGVKNLLGLDQAFNGSQFKKYNVDFSKFTEVLFYDFYNDVRDNPRDSADLYSLIDQFKQKVNYPKQDNSLIVAKEQPKNNLNTRGLNQLMANLRGIKTQEEIELIRKAVMISCVGQVEVMKAIEPGMSEREIQGIHEFVFKKYQAEDVGYPSIVGGGHNGCILHYIDNYKPSLDNKELILMDLGAEFHGYTADITRTIPVNGKFSPEQKLIYELVLNAQEASMKACKPGVDMAFLTTVSREVVNKGLVELGIIKTETEKHLYFPHGVSHHIGLDVHDKGNRMLEPNMAITIEPGIYIPNNSATDPKWWGIAVRIEDDYLVNKEGCELLSGYAPRTVADIEAMMKQSSPLQKFKLPDINPKK
ncbi:MAG TPA: aminopeptidase P family protein [Cyclobacteriaceae bacterium]|nr:aminopeptidase P family protein [Cytophagales bacterium]HNT49289.1 aminopeptidase P family protein [Cyclobacteriaceae bacterium]HRE67135.1 aminopeptidase P family protein [Cyclobacteriaceae bacterium]HRF34770.1 aminopeptidase P family protein [Cyclobacteriaceae bacterium]